MIAIAAGEAHLWYVFQDHIDDADLLARYHALLNPEERERQRRFVVERVRHEYLVTRALCRTTLSHYAAVDPTAWQFSRNRRGRPEISGPRGVAPLRFNLSNTAGLIACLVTLGVDVGVDVEDTQRRGETVRIANRFFSASEVAALDALPPERQRRRFFEYWTLKESYIKARGMGLAIPLNQFSFRLDEDKRITIAFDPRLADDPGAWQFGHYHPSERHLLSFAIRRGARPDFRLEVRETVPLR
jgi:4'-phosphopantetheinyl transferase